MWNVMDIGSLAKNSFANTSSSVGHVYIHPQLSHTPHSCKKAPLRPLLQRRVSGAPYYDITSHSEHDPKPVDGVLCNVIYSKAPSHWRTHFLNDSTQKLKDSRSVRLVSAAPVSEMQDQYRARSAPLHPREPLESHYRTLQALYGQLHQSALQLPKEPELSTAHRDYRRFSRSEMAALSALDVWPTGGPFPKPALSPNWLTLHKAPPRASSQPKLPHLSTPVPHGGRSSVYMDSFRVPSPPPMSSSHVSALAGESCTEKSGRSLLQHILAVPETYATQNRTYGNGRMVLV